MKSVLQDWAMELPLRMQGTLLTCTRGCDLEPKQWSVRGVAYSPGRRLTAFIRYCFMVAADEREIDCEEGAFMMSNIPFPFKPSEFGHLPLHWYTHAMHSLEIIAYYSPSIIDGYQAQQAYLSMVETLHLMPETKEQCFKRLTEDRIEKGEVVS